MTDNRCVALRSRPSGRVRVSDFEIIAATIPRPENGQVLVKNLFISIDPGVRNLLGAQEGYLPPIAVGSPITCSVLGKVVESRHESFASDDLMVGRGAMGDYSIVEPNALCWKVTRDSIPKLSNALGVLGNTGRTAYFGLLEVGKPEPGQTVLVSGAAGAVGSLVGQIAKIKGCRTVGIAGGEAKRQRLLDEFRFDAAIDYRGKSCDELSAAIIEACPNGVDVFFDNVGGTVLDAALPNMNFGGRIAVCGLMSQYDGAAPPQMKNLFFIVAKALRVEGFMLTQFADRYDEAVTFLNAAIEDGALHFREDIYEGLEAAIPAFVRQFEGTTQGKSMVKL